MVAVPGRDGYRERSRLQGGCDREGGAARRAQRDRPRRAPRPRATEVAVFRRRPSGEQPSTDGCEPKKAS